MFRITNLLRSAPRSLSNKERNLIFSYHVILNVNHLQTSSPTTRIDNFKQLKIKSWVTQWREFRLNTVTRNEQDVSVPVLPDSIVEGDLKMIKKVGDLVSTDEVVAEIETDKLSIPVTAPVSGVVVEVYVEASATVRSKQKLLKIKIGPAKPGSTPTPIPGKVATSQSKPQKQITSPPTEKIDVPKKQPPQFLQGAQLKVPPQDPIKEITGLRSEHKVKLSRMRQRIAQRLKDAQNTYAMLTTMNEIDMSYIMAFRKTHQEAFMKKHGVKLGFMSAFLRACVYALQDQPVVNAVIVDNEIIYRDYIDISVAVASPKGLLVPVIRNVDKMNYADIEKAINSLAKKANEGKIAIEDMDGGTFTVSNGGVFGSLMGTPIINPPQSAILGMHGVFERPVAVNHQVVIRPMMYVALTYDHRLIDGREAVLFLRKIKAGVENPTIILSGL